MSTNDRIKEFIKLEYKSAFLSGSLKEFEYDHKKLSESYPEGDHAYFKMQLYKLKEEYISTKYGYYLRNWIRCDCFEFAYLEGFQHLADHCKKTFVKMFESDAGDFALYQLKDGEKAVIEYIYNSNFKYINLLIKEFYTCASKIRSLEKMALAVSPASPRPDGNQSFIFSYERLTPLYDLCNVNHMFIEEYNLTDFINCFDLNYNADSKVFPKFKRGSQTKFVYILSEIQKLNPSKNFDQTVANSFGIKKYYNALQTTNPDLVFKNAVNKALGLK